MITGIFSNQCSTFMICFSVLPEELLSLLSSGLAGVAEDDLEEALGRSRGEEGGGASGGRESRVSLYEFSDPLLQVCTCVVGVCVCLCIVASLVSN